MMMRTNIKQHFVILFIIKNFFGYIICFTLFIITYEKYFIPIFIEGKVRLRKIKLICLRSYSCWVAVKAPDFL